MPNVAGTYQDMPILEGEFDFKAGLEPGRGIIRVLLDPLPQDFDLTKIQLEQVKKLFDRSGGKLIGPADVGTTWLPSREGTKATVVADDSRRIPPQNKNLQGPFGQLVFSSDQEFDIPASKIPPLNNIFWIDATLEGIDSKVVAPGGGPVGAGVVAKERAIIRLEIVDERIIWGMGGYVFGSRNVILNEASGDSLESKIYEWRPTVADIAKVQEFKTDTEQRTGIRPLMDPRTIREGPISEGAAPKLWSLFDLIVQCLDHVPGPPVRGFITGKAGTITPFNVNWGPGILARDALRDLLTRFNMVLTFDYDGKVNIYERGEKAVAGIVGPGGPVIIDPDTINKKFWSEENERKLSSSLQITPFAVEVIGKRIREEVMCPLWQHVIKGDGKVDIFPGVGTTPQSLLKQAGRWYRMSDVLASWGYSFDAAARSIMANFDKKESAMFSDVPPQGNAQATKEIRGKRQGLLRQHFMRSFMVFGAFRTFLPMITKRAEPRVGALNLPRLSIARDAVFYTDGWRPNQLRFVGSDTLFDNFPLEPVDPTDISRIDERAGVITFREPMGIPVYRTEFRFFDGSVSPENFLVAAKVAWNQDVETFRAELQEVIDRNVYIKPPFTSATVSGNFFIDRFESGRIAARKFLERRVPAIQKVLRDLKVIGDSNIQSGAQAAGDQFLFGSQTQVEEEIANLSAFVTGALERFNLSEFRLEEPRILGIWTWERNTGNWDDYYRLRIGVDPQMPAFPVRNENLVQYVTYNGETNKRALDFLAKQTAEEFLDKRQKALAGRDFLFAGFHPILPSGQIPQVTFKISLQDPPDGTTETVVEKYNRGIAGSRPAIATWPADRTPAQGRIIRKVGD